MNGETERMRDWPFVLYTSEYSNRCTWISMHAVRDAVASCHEVGGSAGMSTFGVGSPVMFRP